MGTEKAESAFAFPREVRREIGAALYAAQQGDTNPAAKPMKGSAEYHVLLSCRPDVWRKERWRAGSRSQVRVTDSAAFRYSRRDKLFRK
jgi:hypothetical protein